MVVVCDYAAHTKMYTSRFVCSVRSVEARVLLVHQQHMLLVHQQHMLLVHQQHML
mgnify:CR=1 FL=1